MLRRFLAWPASLALFGMGAATFLASPEDYARSKPSEESWNTRDGRGVITSLKLLEGHRFRWVEFTVTRHAFTSLREVEGVYVRNGHRLVLVPDKAGVPIWVGHIELGDQLVIEGRESRLFARVTIREM